jgi:threonine dehydratase
MRAAADDARQESQMPVADLSLANIEKAARLIDPVFRNSPQFVDEQLNAALGRHVVVKVETANPVRSFKGRGADFWALSFDPRQHAVCASAGNFGQAVAYAGRSRGFPVTVFVPQDVNPVKRARMEALGARVSVGGLDGDVAKARAREFAEGSSGRVFIEDGEDPAIAEGAGTIAVELLESGGIDAVVVPVGDGALITGMALWLREHSPHTRIVGVCAGGAPAMAESWKAGGQIVSVPPDTIADGLAIRTPIARSVERIRALVDDIVLVDDEALRRAMRIAAGSLGLLLEPAGAAGLAAIGASKISGERIATVLTGSNVDPSLAAELLGV